jgi:hypothetical protein
MTTKHQLLTNYDLPLFPVIGHLVSHSVLGERGSSHDVDQDAWHILPAGGLFVLFVPATMPATEKRPHTILAMNATKVQNIVVSM